MKITDVTTKVVDLLNPFDSTERRRIMQAAFMLLGEEDAPISRNQQTTVLQNGSDDVNAEKVSRQAIIWMKQNSISMEQLQEVFHIDNGSTEVIASEIPGRDIKVKTCNAYILTGLCKFLVSGDPSFDDKDGRTLCVRSGAFIAKNHSRYLKGAGNKMAGSKDAGWKLTTPGLKYGADLIKQIKND